MQTAKILSRRAISFGIVGGIGSGKSFVTAEFVRQGAVSFDADAEAKELYKDADVRAMIKNRWERVVLESGEIDRQLLARIVFAPTEAGRRELNFLNGIVRPRLFSKFERWLDQMKTEGRELLILDAPLLFEAGWDKNVDYIVFVDAPYEVRLRRVLARGWSRKELDARESNQIALDVKRKHANFVVRSVCDDSHMDVQVSQVLAAVYQDSARG